MFAIVRTGGKQYRVAAGDKIVVEKLAGAAGDTITLSDVLFAGDGGETKSTDGLTVSAEIVAQAKADKVTVFKKKRRHNYRRKRGHRQQLTILRIVAIGGKKAGEEGRQGRGRPGRRQGRSGRGHQARQEGSGAEARGSGQGRRRGVPEAHVEAPLKAGATRAAPAAKAAQGRGAEKVDKEARRR